MIKEESTSKLPFWREYPDRDTEFVRVYPTLYGELSEEDIWTKKEAVIYLYIPYCKGKCTSCPNILDEVENVAQYVNALKKELLIYAKEAYIQDLIISSIYIAGGTPTTLDVSQIEELIVTIKDNFNLNSKIEITIEATPSSIDYNKAIELKNIGVTRISLGVQSFVDKELKELKRGHTKNKAIELIEQLKSVEFECLNIDLLIGVPSQTKETWLESLEIAISVGVDSISFYSFFLLETADLMTKLISGRIGKIVEEDVLNAWFADSKNILVNSKYEEFESCGFEIYSGYRFSKSGLGCRYYRSICEKDVEVIGAGIFASGHLNGKWYINHNNMNSYFNALESERLPLMKGAEINKEDYMRRYMILGFKLGAVSIKGFYDTFGLEPIIVFKPILDELIKEELITISDDLIKLTEDKGYFYVANVCKSFYSDENKKCPQILSQSIVV